MVKMGLAFPSLRDIRELPTDTAERWMGFEIGHRQREKELAELRRMELELHAAADRDLRA